MKPNLRLRILLIIVLLMPFESALFAQNTKPPIDPFSYSSCYILGEHNSKPIFRATGFFLRLLGKTYLITNNQVVSAEFYINEYKAKPNQVPPIDSMATSLKVRAYSKTIGSVFFITVQLIDKEKPLYIKFWQDDAKTRLMDVVAIPLTDAISIQLNQTVVYEESNLNATLLLVPSTELFILGFPNKYGENQPYPLWKRGTIASEPNLSNYGSYFFFIDATTRKGMSGSPVVFRGSTYTDKNGTHLSSGGPVTFLLGIYSAQDSLNEIGIVWKLNKIIEDLKKLP